MTYLCDECCYLGSETTCPNCGGIATAINDRGTPRQTRYEAYLDKITPQDNREECEEEEPGRYAALEYGDGELVWMTTENDPEGCVRYLNGSDTSRTGETIVDLDTGQFHRTELRLVEAKPEIVPPADAFGLAWWTDEDIKDALKEKDKKITDDNIAAIRGSWYARHIADTMIEAGWGNLWAAAEELPESENAEEEQEADEVKE